MLTYRESFRTSQQLEKTFLQIYLFLIYILKLEFYKGKHEIIMQFLNYGKHIYWEFLKYLNFLENIYHTLLEI